MEFKCKKDYKAINNKLMIKDTWYELKFFDLPLGFDEENFYNFFYTKQELRKEKIKKLLNG